MKGLGADDVLDYTKGDEVLSKQLRDIAAAHGKFDMCLDTVSSVEEKDRMFRYEAMIRESSSRDSILTGRYVFGGHCGDVDACEEVTGRAVEHARRKKQWSGFSSFDAYVHGFI